MWDVGGSFPCPSRSLKGWLGTPTISPSRPCLPKVCLSLIVKTSPRRLFTACNADYPHEQVETVADVLCSDANDTASDWGGVLGRSDTVQQQATEFGWTPVLVREQKLYRAAYEQIPENTKGRLQGVKTQGLNPITYQHQYDGDGAHFIMEVKTTPKDTTRLDYLWDRGSGMFTTLTTNRPAINAQLVDTQRRRWDRYEVTYYEFDPENGQMSRISRWLEDQNGNPVEGSPGNPLWQERYEYQGPLLQRLIDRQCRRTLAAIKSYGSALTGLGWDNRV